MKCWRILYLPDDTAFMVWAETEGEAFGKAKARNEKELENNGPTSRKDYLVDEFTPKTNNTGILAFYDVYSTFERKDIDGNFIECRHHFGRDNI